MDLVQVRNVGTRLETESLNFREADNLTARTESLVEYGELQGREVFLFTDNSTFESTYYKGYYTSRKKSRIIPWLYQTIQDGSTITPYHTCDQKPYESMGS